MELINFVKDFAELFEETDANFFKPSTKFRDIEEWSSLVALSVIAMAFVKYKVRLSGDDIRKSLTIEDIFNIVKAKQ
ncbi:MAG: acyl carrier protein [Bacteroidales bacterium]|nr:acyl carrier protein [Bacteroidales bacterium]